MFAMMERRGSYKEPTVASKLYGVDATIIIMFLYKYK